MIIAASAASALAQSNDKNGADDVNGGISFKVPENVFPMDWKKSEFKGILFLQKDGPSGMFISYPNDGETIDDLIKRAAKFIAPMISNFGKDTNSKAEFEVRTIPAHENDSVDSASYYAFKDSSVEVQILFYERTDRKDRKLIYGYFSRRDLKSEKSGDKTWADQNGNGVKSFDKFWKTIKK